MLIGYNQATTLKSSNVETDLKYAEKYGYDFIEFQMGQLNDYFGRKSISDLKEFFSQSNIKPYSLNALEYFNLKKGEEFEKIKNEFLKMCKISKEIACDSIIIVPSPKKDSISEDEIKKDSIDSINILADIGEQYGIKLAIELIGLEEFSINNFSQCYEIVQEINRNNVGMVMDCFHFYTGGSKIEDLRKADSEKIFVFHIDDSKDLPLNELRDSDRLWPGDGVIPLDKILGALKFIGFDGVVTVELFNPEYWKWEPEKAIKVAKEKTEDVINRFYK